MIVLDASVVVELLGDTLAGQTIARRISGETSLSAPHLLDVEVVSALRRQERLGALTRHHAGRMLGAFAHLPITRYGHLPLVDRIWEMRHNFTAYDACYLALAEAFGTVLLTRDAPLSAARLRRGRVELI